MNTGKLLSLPEVAERTSTSVAFWRKAVQRQEVPIIKVGRLIRLREEDVDAFCRFGYRIDRRNQCRCGRASR